MDIVKRYQTDPDFNAAVLLILEIIKNCEGTLTPLDMRDACYLARMIYERENIRPIILPKGF